MEGWIKTHRKILQSDTYRNLTSKQFNVMQVCLLLASHKENKWEFDGEIYTVKPGQFITSLQNLKKQCVCDVSVQSVRTALLKLERWGFLTKRSTRKSTLITICNWERYQLDAHKEQHKEQQTANTQLTNNQHTANTQLTTINNDKNVNTEKECENDKKNNPIISLGTTSDSNVEPSVNALFLEAVNEASPSPSDDGSEKAEVDLNKTSEENIDTDPAIVEAQKKIEKIKQEAEQKRKQSSLDELFRWEQKNNGNS